MSDHKLYELTINENGVRLRYSNPNPLSAEQKYTIALTAIIATAVILFFGFLFLTV